MNFPFEKNQWLLSSPTIFDNVITSVIESVYPIPAQEVIVFTIKFNIRPYLLFPPASPSSTLLNMKEKRNKTDFQYKKGCRQLKHMAETMSHIEGDPLIISWSFSNLMTFKSCINIAFIFFFEKNFYSGDTHRYHFIYITEI